jgi:hypothetical protein
MPLHRFPSLPLAPTPWIERLCTPRKVVPRRGPQRVAARPRRTRRAGRRSVRGRGSRGGDRVTTLSARFDETSASRRLGHVACRPARTVGRLDPGDPGDDRAARARWTDCANTDRAPRGAHNTPRARLAHQRRDPPPRRGHSIGGAAGLGARQRDGRTTHSTCTGSSSRSSRSTVFRSSLVGGHRERRRQGARDDRLPPRRSPCRK